MAAKKKGAKKAAKKAIVKKATATKPSKKKTPKRQPARANKARVASPEVYHWELQAKDPKKMQRFYADLFGWKINAANPMNYGMVASKGKDGINGGIGGTPPNGQSRVLVYATVADIDGVLEKAAALGARTLMPRTDIGMVIMGIFEDVEGNHFGLIEA